MSFCKGLVIKKTAWQHWSEKFPLHKFQTLQKNDIKMTIDWLCLRSHLWVLGPVDFPHVCSFSLKPTIHPQCPCSWQCNARQALIRERHASHAARFIRWHANVRLLTEKTWGSRLLVLALACTWAHCTSQQADRIKTSEIAAWPESGISANVQQCKPPQLKYRAPELVITNL